MSDYYFINGEDVDEYKESINPKWELNPLLKEAVYTGMPELF